MRRHVLLVLMGCSIAGRAVVGQGVVQEDRLLVVCAPGHPGTADQAMPTLETFTALLSHRTGHAWAPVFCDGPDDGVRLLGRPGVRAALVTLPFLAEFGRSLGLDPLARPVAVQGDPAPWVLVAGKGKLTKPSGLAGWEVTSRSGYAKRFVTALLAEGFGPLPADIRVTYTSRALGALRRAAAGENVAVLLDGEEAVALQGLPFADRLDVVVRSKPLPLSLFAVVGSRTASEMDRWVEALVRMGEEAAGRAVLQEMRIARFERVNPGERRALIRWIDQTPRRDGMP